MTHEHDWFPDEIHFERMARGFERLAEAGERFAESIVSLTVAMQRCVDPLQPVPSRAGRVMVWFACRALRMPYLDALVWLEQFPFAFADDFGDGWQE